ncbi:Nitric oxide dioxygenase [Planctomycetales bacterium 10988]|nr:Nitric oxide dioxygenase [Planctomycetales bacterium 10988]
MTPEEITLVKASWEEVKPISEKAAELFYGRLFETDPTTIPLFANANMKEQGKKLMTTITLCVTSLDRLPQILPTVQALGKKHNVEYQVKPEHYDSVGAALLWTLEQGLGDKWTPETQAAWTKTYVTLADAMKAST